MIIEVEVHPLELAKAIIKNLKWFSDDYLMEISNRIDRELQNRKENK